MAREVYACRACGREVEPEREGRAVMVRNRQVLLVCGHTASPHAIHVHLDAGDAEMAPEAEEALWDRLGRSNNPGDQP
jgi:hypothetical protein